jgi:hypothetical protein
MNDIIKKITEFLNKNFIETEYLESHPKFSDSRYKPFKISKDNFHKIDKIDNESKITFVDGGNLEILKAADFSLSLVRIYYSIYKNNKKIRSKKLEFYALIYADNKDGEIFYKTKLFSENKEILPDEEDLIFNSFDSSLRRGLHRIDISRIAGVIRRFSELKIASEVIKELNKGDVLVLDGSLQSAITNENKYLNCLFKKGLERNISITALSKSCTLMTDRGSSLIAILGMICPEGRWYYYPVVEINSLEHQAEMFFVKFHEKSKHIFRFEIYKKQKFNIGKILSLIAENSNDPIFLGYPYGLIEADKFARISNNELDYFKTMLTLKLGKVMGKLDKNLSARNAHDILDKISY